MQWDDVRFFLAVARGGSLSAAARDLQVNQSTVSRRISAFEDSLNVRLFERLPGGYVLTQAGREMLGGAERMEAEAVDMERTIEGRDMRMIGVLRVAASHILCTHLLLPHFGRFMEAHPGIELRVDATEAFANLHRREADVAIRGTEKPPESLVGRQIAELGYAVYGRRGVDWSDDAPTICYVGRADDVVHEKWFRERFPRCRVQFRVTSPNVMLDAAREGLGLARVPCLMGDQVPELERLTPVMDTAYPVWILTHPDMRHTARVRAFMNFMGEALARDADLLEGRRPMSEGGVAVG